VATSPRKETALKSVAIIVAGLPAWLSPASPESHSLSALCASMIGVLFFRRIIGMADKVDFVYFITLRDTSSVQTLGKAPITLGKGFAECDTWQLL